MSISSWLTSVVLIILLAYYFSLDKCLVWCILSVRLTWLLLIQSVDRGLFILPDHIDYCLYRIVLYT
ncbi:MAG: hypothetical protein GKC53_06740 [Neisseriaceae bacterium]|nr:MAG: hypothetical protein GKC53_06740 [Neisseriaceae bacterium]